MSAVTKQVRNPDSPFKLGNQAMREGDMVAAIRNYLLAIETEPAFSKMIVANLVSARQKYRTQRVVSVKQRAGVCGWELSHGAAERVLTLAKLYESFADVEIIGSHFPQWGTELWEPIRNSNIEYHGFVVLDESHFIEQALQLVAAHPYDLVHLSNPRAPNIFFGILYKLIWGSQIIVDLDQEETASVTTEKPENFEKYLNQFGKLNKLSDLVGLEWTRFSISLLHDFDGITVASTALHCTYGGEVIDDMDNSSRLLLVLRTAKNNSSLTTQLRQLICKYALNIETISQYVRYLPAQLKSIQMSNWEMNNQTKAKSDSICKNLPITTKTTISIIITSHNEASILMPTLRAAEAACEYAEVHGLTTDILMILDYASPQTESIALAFKNDSKISVALQKTEFGCPALSRNFGISMVHSEYIAIQDADDLMSVNWLIDAVNLIKNNSKLDVVAHPQWNITFGFENVMMQHPCMLTDQNFYYGNLIFENYWTALCIARKNIFERIKYTSNKGSKTFGYEDWEWNLKCIEKNILHITAKDTFHFIRKKRFGVSHMERGESRIVRPTGFLRNKRFLDSVLFQSERERLLTHYGENIFDEECYLRCNPDIAAGVKIGFFKNGLEHYTKSGRQEGRIAHPHGLLKQLMDICKFDYGLFPEQSLLAKYKYYKSNKISKKSNNAVNLFEDLNLILNTRTIGCEFDCVLIAPWIFKGGADLALLFHLQYLVYKGKKVLLILTEDRDSPWLSRVPSCITIHNFGKLTPELSREEKRVLLFYILMLLKVKTLHVINSQTAWDVLSNYGEIIHSTMKIDVSLYCYDYSDEGKPVGYPFFLQECSEWVDLIYSDNSFFVKHLHDYYGIDYSKQVVLNHPICIKDGEADFYDCFSNNILWASRLDRQKRPDILLEVAKSCPEFNFLVFGSSILDESDILIRLQALSNVKLMGPFDGFLSLSSNKYFAFLYTSQWDGLPNILLEAAACGLPIVAPAIGGISDFLRNGRGLLCDGTEAVEDYVKNLKLLSTNNDIAKEIKSLMSRFLARYHTYEFFFEQLTSSDY